jgi:hypothetical protein
LEVTEIFFGSSDVTSPKPASTDRSASEAYLARYIPECSHGSILVTTRNKSTGVHLTRGRGVMEIGHKSFGRYELVKVHSLSIA